MPSQIQLHHSPARDLLISDSTRSFPLSAREIVWLNQQWPLQCLLRLHPTLKGVYASFLLSLHQKRFPHGRTVQKILLRIPMPCEPKFVLPLPNHFRVTGSLSAKNAQRKQQQHLRYLYKPVRHRPFPQRLCQVFLMISSLHAQHPLKVSWPSNLPDRIVQRMCQRY